MDDQKIPANKYGRNSNKEGVTTTTIDSAGGATTATKSTGSDDGMVAPAPVKEVPFGCAKTGKMFAQSIYHNDKFKYSNFL